MPGLTPVHREHLLDHAVNIDLALSLGVFSAESAKDLPQDRRAGLGRHLPGLVFPWTGADGHVEYQVKPDDPSKDSRGRMRKYVFRSKKQGYRPILWAARPNEDATSVLIVEGTKQTLAAASWAPEEYAVYGIGGCRMWQSEGLPIEDLYLVDGRQVCIILDADAASNSSVYQAGENLGHALEMEGATRVRFARLPGTGTDGLDDILAKRKSDRAEFVGRLVASAKAKPADRKPKGKVSDDPDKYAQEDRPAVVVNGDPKTVMDEILGTMAEKWDSDSLFCYGGAITRRIGTELHPLSKDEFGSLLQRAVVTIAQNAQGDVSYRWPDNQTMGSMLSEANRFASLNRIAQAPFVRPDGTICQKSGYDTDTKTFLCLDPEMEGVKVPNRPTVNQVHKAVELIMDDWLGDFEFGDDASRANLLGLVLTPLVRGHVPVVPMAVIDGIQMGVGKNLLADIVAIVATGRNAEPMPFSHDDEELRKGITGAFRGGQEIFVYDEAHEIKGKSVAQALTATTWRDRILGASRIGAFPNTVTWMALGNQVKVYGDVIRRVYRIFLKPRHANPQDRPDSDFRHPDLREWTKENRKEILQACLTLVRSWFAERKPAPSRINFGSFEVWQRCVGGIIENAGVPGFLDNISEWRSESDFYTQYWAAHLAWLRETFGDTEFSASTVRQESLSDLANYQAPPSLDDPAEKVYTKRLGESYSRIKDRRFGTLYLTKVRIGHNHIARWAVGDDSEGEPRKKPPSGSGGDDGSGRDTPGGSPSGQVKKPRQRATKRKKPRSARAEGEETARPDGAGPPIAFDIEGADARLMHSYGPGYARLAGWKSPGSDPVLTTDMHDLVSTITESSMSTGHNIIGFDLQVLAKYYGLPMETVHKLAKEKRLFDSLLAVRQIDPPMARDTGVAAQRRHDLDQIGKRYELGAKTGDLKALAKEFGGYDQIPLDEPRYNEYLRGDIQLSEDVKDCLTWKMTETDRDYVWREHRIAAIAAQFTYNGFLADTELLAERVNEGNQRKQECLDKLAHQYGVPLKDGKGKPYKAPLSSKVGKERLIQIFEEHGATFWRTENSGDIMLTHDSLKHLFYEYHHIPEVREVTRLVDRVVTTRTVYTTIMDNLVGDRVYPRVSMGQSTGRWSTTSPGLTVMGKRSGRHIERNVLIADPGTTLIAVDLSQVDMRGIAGLSGDQAYINMLMHDDPHMEISKALFGDDQHRDESKAIGHGWNYGRTPKAIAMAEEIAPHLVMMFDRQMKERFPRLVEWREEVRAQAESGALLDNGWGRKMKPDPIRAHTQGPALMGQGSARDIMMKGLLTLADRRPEYLPMLRAQVHDEIVLAVPENDAEEIERDVIECLSFEWRGVPIVADGGARGKSWGSCYEKG